MASYDSLPDVRDAGFVLVSIGCVKTYYEAVEPFCIPSSNICASTVIMSTMVQTSACKMFFLTLTNPAAR